MRRFAIALVAICAGGLLAGCNFTTRNQMAFAPSVPRASVQPVHNLAYTDEDDKIMLASYRPSRHGQRRGGSRCPSGMTWNASAGKCLSEKHDIPLSDADRTTLSNCDEIQTRIIWRGSRRVEQQRCARASY